MVARTDGENIPSAAEAKAHAAEESVALVRFAVIAFNVAVYWPWIRPQGIPWLAAVISVIALSYGTYVVLARPYRRFPILATSAWTASTDGVLIVLWILATGGVDSPFYLLWYLSLMAVTFRYDRGVTVVWSAIYALAYLGLAAATGQLWIHRVDMAVRITYILLAGALGSLLARESFLAFQERFHLAAQMREAQRFRALADASQEAVAIHRDGIFLEVNQALCELVGRTRQHLLGQPAVGLVLPESKTLAQHRITVPREDSFEVWFTGLGGRRRLARVQERAIDYQGTPARVVVARDITDERAAEEARDGARRAEMEVQRLREMDRFKTDFINTAAHELNTPLTPLKLQLHLLNKQVPPGDSLQRRTVDILDRNLDRLALLVQDMLDVAKLQSGRLRLDPQTVDLSALLLEGIDTFRETAAQKGIDLQAEVASGLSTVADPKRLTQVFYNLLSNAFKFTPHDGLVHVSAQVQAGDLAVTVQDSGVGMTAEQQARLFQPFTQVHRDQLATGGTGLGLYVSRGIMERHGGSLSCHSDGPGLGSTFTMRLPVLAPASKG